METDGALRGQLLESFVAMELVKLAAVSEVRPTVHHFRTTTGREVDVVLEAPDGRVVGVEVKAAVSLADGDLKGLRTLAEAAKDKFVRGVVLYRGEQVIPFAPNLAAVPISALWRV